MIHESFVADPSLVASHGVNSFIFFRDVILQNTYFRHCQEIRATGLFCIYSMESITWSFFLKERQFLF